MKTTLSLSQLFVQSGIGGQAGIPKPLYRIPPGVAVAPQFATKQLLRQFGTELGGRAHITAVVFSKRDTRKSLLETVSRFLVAQLFKIAYDVATIGTRGDGGLDMCLGNVAVVTIDEKLTKCLGQKRLNTNTSSNQTESK